MVVIAIPVCLIKIHGVHATTQCITHHIDSTTVRDRLNKKMNLMIMTDHSLGGTDYDVWAETAELLKHPNITIQYVHAKGHQADTLEKKHKVRGPLQRNAHYNEVCDSIAGETRTQNEQSLQTTMFPSLGIALFLNGKTFVTASVHTSITNHITGAIMEAYVQDQNKMTDEVIQAINWEAMGRYMKGMPKWKRVKICKYMHNWQKKGRQKQKFAQAA